MNTMDTRLHIAVWTDLRSKGECLEPSSWFLNTLREVADSRAESGNEQEEPGTS